MSFISVDFVPVYWHQCLQWLGVWVASQTSSTVKWNKLHHHWRPGSEWHTMECCVQSSIEFWVL